MPYTLSEFKYAKYFRRLFLGVSLLKQSYHVAPGWLKFNCSLFCLKCWDYSHGPLCLAQASENRT